MELTIALLKALHSAKPACASMRGSRLRFAACTDLLERLRTPSGAIKGSVEEVLTDHITGIVADSDSDLPECT